MEQVQLDRSRTGISPEHKLMKKNTIISMLALCAVAGAGEKPIPSVPMSERTSHDTLASRFVKRQESMKAQAVKPKPKVPEISDARREEWKPVNLLERSEFLSYRGQTTLVPKGALLNVPARYADRVRFSKGTKIIRWPEFLRGNLSWISTYEVNRRQAEAEVPLTEEELESIRKNPQVVVATMSGGPITVLRKAPETAAQTAAVDAKTEATPTTPVK